MRFKGSSRGMVQLASRPMLTGSTSRSRVAYSVGRPSAERFRILTVIIGCAARPRGPSERQQDTGAACAALAARRHRHFLPEHARGVVPLEGLRVVTGNPGDSLVVDLAQALRRLAVAGAGGADVDLHGVAALALLLEGRGLLEQRLAAGGS